MDKEYRVACPPGEREALVASAHHLDSRMKEIRDSGKVVGVDRIAVMAALNLAHELLDQQARDSTDADRVRERIRALQERIDVALDKTARQLQA
ncbi:MAG: cell division protein ZapA [Gammaproteobacteria bacterium]|nr:cell division protein ZapA [Gammaproteobacteria bacterium]